MVHNSHIVTAALNFGGQDSRARYYLRACLLACDHNPAGAKKQNNAPGFHEQEKFMSKVALLAAVSAVLVLGACEKHKRPAPMEPIAAPIYVEPVSSKSKY